MKPIALAVLLLAACNKPSPESCRKALLNMERLLGTENLGTEQSLEGEVRRCRGGSSKESVECASKASTFDELKRCDFYKVADQPAGSGSAK